MPVLSQYSLEGKTAILYTAGGNDAPFLAQAIAEAGASVFTIARQRNTLDAVQEALGGIQGSRRGVVATLDSGDAVAGALAEFDLLHNQVDILVNDSRSMFARKATEIEQSEWDAVQSRNVRATFLLSQAVGTRMIAAGYGRVVNIISGLAERGMVNGLAFSVSQAGLLALTRSLAVEWGPHNVRVNAIGTGWSIAEDIPVEVQREEQLVRYIPQRRKGHPRDVGPLLVYLCSEACDYTTGQPVYVDGGLNAHP
ncbi:MAG: SDR family oxidoreductase [Chloroflexota bacterium]|nr:SDR family oxidoreductase [Chloroflexota bacterium]